MWRPRWPPERHSCSCLPLSFVILPEEPCMAQTSCRQLLGWGRDESTWLPEAALPRPSCCPFLTDCKTSHLATGCSWSISPAERPSSRSRCYSTWPPTWGAVSRTRGICCALPVGSLGLRSSPGQPEAAICLVVSSGSGGSNASAFHKASFFPCACDSSWVCH